MTALTLDQVRKQYRAAGTAGAVEAVRGVSLRVEAGQRVALLGPNGAGKTTLLKLILGLTPVSSGVITVLGAPPGSRAARRATGYLPENVAFHGALSGREQLHHFARLKSVAPRAADHLLEQVGLAAAAARKTRHYSKGMRQRLGLAQALLGHPRLVLLDEPTSGLDPAARREFHDRVGELARAGAAVLISSHGLTDLETRAERIVIVNRGKVVADGDLATLRKAARLPVRFLVTTAGDAAAVAARFGGRRITDHSFELTCGEDGKMELLGRITALGRAVKDIDMTPPSLEAIYRRHCATDEAAGRDAGGAGGEGEGEAVDALRRRCAGARGGSG